MKKIGEWLKDLNSHEIYSEPELTQDFEKATGKIACWPTHSVGKTSSTLGEFKGVVGPLEGKDHERCSYGYQIANCLESSYTKSYEGGKYNGRGFSFRASLEAIQKAAI